MNPMFSIFFLSEQPHHIFVWWAKLFASVWVGKSPVGEQTKNPAAHRLSLSVSKVNFILFISIIRILVQKLRCPDVGGNDQSQYRYFTQHVAIKAKNVYVFSVWSEVPQTFIILFVGKNSIDLAAGSLSIHSFRYQCTFAQLKTFCSVSLLSDQLDPLSLWQNSKWCLQDVLHSTAKEEAVSL